MVLSEKTLYSLGRRCVYIFNRRKAKKEIPAKVPTPIAGHQKRNPAHKQTRPYQFLQTQLPRRPIADIVPQVVPGRHASGLAHRAQDLPVL